MRRQLLVVLLVAGCTPAPDLDSAISESSLAASYPKLIALENQTTTAAQSNGAEVINELETRTAGLWSRIGSLFN